MEELEALFVFVDAIESSIIDNGGDGENERQP